MKRILFFMTLVLVALQGWATDVNPASLQFSTDVGQTETQTISIKFADAEIPPDPNTPVVMSPSYGTPLQSIGQASGDYSVSIQGAGSQMFSAEITMGSFTSNACTVKVSYNPSAEGTHQATLNVNCSSAGVPTVSVNLTGSTTSASDDPFTNLPTGLGSVTTGNGKGLPEGFVVDNPANVKPDIRIVKEIFDLLKESPLFYLVEVDESETFNNVTLGSTTTKRFEAHVIPDTEWVLDLLSYHLGRIKIKLNLISAQIEQDGIPVIGSEMFSVYPSSLGVSDLRNHKEITVTYKPTAVGMHAFVFAHTYDLSLLNLTDYPDLIDYLTVLPTPLSAPYIGTAVDRHITVNPSTYAFEPTYKDDVKTKKITVKGTNLTGNLNVTPSSSSNFTVNPTTITAAQAQSANGAEVMVTYNPKAVGSHSATFTISGGEALPETFSVTGDCINQGSITVDKTSLIMDPVYEGEQGTATFTITGENLLAPITLVEPWSETIGGEFSISPKTLPKTGGTVTVTYTPSDAHTSGAQFKFKSGNLMVSVDVTAKCLSKPTITRSLSSWNFGTVALNSNNTKKITVRGYNLTGDLNITPERSSYFTISPTTITAAQAQSANGVEVTVTYNPKAVGSHSATFAISGGGATPMPINISGSCANLTASTTELDMGSTYVGTPLTATFTLTGTNLTEGITLVQPWIETLDGNEFSVSPTTLPKIGGTVTVTYTPSDAHTSSAAFKFKSGDQVVNVCVTAKGLAVPRITTSKTSLDFGTIALDKDSIQTFKVYGYDLTGDLTVSSSNTKFKVNPTTISKTNAANGVTVTVTYKPTAAGNHSGTITIKGGGATDKTIPVTGKCASLTASVSELNMDPVYVGEQGTATFTITGVNLSEAITLVQPWSETIGGEFSISPTTLPKTGGTVTVTYTPSDAHTSGAAFKFKSGNMIVNIAVTAKGIAKPTITRSLSSWDFGTVAKNSNNTKKITVRGYNLTGDLTITPASSSYFSVSPTTITAAQAQSTNGVEVTITYKPTARGSHSATFTIKGGGATPQTVAVSGKCAEITTTESELHFASNYSQKFTVKGYYLTGNLTVRSDNAVFTVTPSSITPSQAASGVEVTVTCNAASNLQHTSGKIIISGGSAASMTVKLSYDKTGAEPQAPLVTPEDDGENGNDEFSNVSLQEAFGGPTSDVNELSMSSKVYAEGLNIIIETPIEQKALISDIAGHIREVNLQAGRNEVPVNANGIYIVRIREKSTKLMLK